MDEKPNNERADSVESTNTTFYVLASWVPLIAFLLIAGLAFVIVKSVVQLQTTLRFVEVLARLAWSISVLFFAFTILVTFALAFKEIWAARNLRTVQIIVLVLIAVSVASIKLLPGIGEFEFNKAILADTVYKFANPAQNFVSGVQISAAGALAALCVAVSLVLARARRKTDPQSEPSIEVRAARLAREQQVIRNLLYAGAIALVAGTLQAAALYAWGVTMLNQPSTLDFGEVDAIPKLMGLLNGAFYSILLAVIFAPAFIYLRTLAVQLAEESKPDSRLDDRETWLQTHAISSSVPQQLFSAAAVLAPTIVGGPLTTLLGLIIPS